MEISEMSFNVSSEVSNCFVVVEGQLQNNVAFLLLFL